MHENMQFVPHPVFGRTARSNMRLPVIVPEDNDPRYNCSPHRVWFKQHPGGSQAIFFGHWQCAPSGMRTNCLKQGRSMFVNVNAHPGSKPKALGQLGELSRARVIAERIQIQKGYRDLSGRRSPPIISTRSLTVRFVPTSSSPMDAARSALSILREIFLGWRTVPPTDLPRRQSSIRQYG